MLFTIFKHSIVISVVLILKYIFDMISFNLCLRKVVNLRDWADHSFVNKPQIRTLFMNGSTQLGVILFPKVSLPKGTNVLILDLSLLMINDMLQVLAHAFGRVRVVETYLAFD